MAKKEPRGTREMNSGRNQERNRGNGENRGGNERQATSGGARSGQARTGSEWREMDRQPGGGRGTDTRHAGGGRFDETSHDMSRYDMESNTRGGNRQSGSRGGRGQGGGQFPMDNLTYNVVTVLHEKSKGLEAFDRYLQDARGDDVADLLEEIREQDERAIEELQEHLHRLLSQGNRGRRVA